MEKGGSHCLNPTAIFAIATTNRNWWHYSLSVYKIN